MLEKKSRIFDKLRAPGTSTRKARSDPRTMPSLRVLKYLQFRNRSDDKGRTSLVATPNTSPVTIKLPLSRYPEISHCSSNSTAGHSYSIKEGLVVRKQEPVEVSINSKHQDNTLEKVSNNYK